MALSEESCVDEFLIKSPDGSGELLFYNRTPFDPNEPINSC